LITKGLPVRNAQEKCSFFFQRSEFAKAIVPSSRYHQGQATATTDFKEHKIWIDTIKAELEDVSSSVSAARSLTKT
jgi:hypothetical protein